MRNADDVRRRIDWTAKCKYDLQSHPRRSIEAQNQDARCFSMTMARTQVVFQESLHMRLELQTPLTSQVARTPPWTVTVNGPPLITMCITTHERSFRRCGWKEKGRNDFYE